jgi:hypothetical protein
MRYGTALAWIALLALAACTRDRPTQPTNQTLPSTMERHAAAQHSESTQTTVGKLTPMRPQRSLADGIGVTLTDDDGNTWTYNATPNENGYPTLTSGGVTIELADSDAAAQILAEMAGTIETDPLADELESAVAPYASGPGGGGCGTGGVCEEMRAAGDSTKGDRPRRDLRLRWKFPGHEWEPPNNFVPLPWEPRRHPGPSVWLDEEDLNMLLPSHDSDLSTLLAPLPQFSCSDVADGAILGAGNFKQKRTSFLRWFAEDIGLVGLSHGLYRIYNWQFFAPGGTFLASVGTFEYWLADHLYSRVNVGFLAAMWNQLSCASQLVTANVQIVVGDGGSVGGLTLTCYIDWIPLNFGGVDYWIRANICEYKKMQ